MPLFIPPAPDWQLYEPDILNGTAAARTTNGIYWQGIYVPAPCVVTGFRVQNGTGGSGHMDLGIYDSSANGNLLAHVGSTATASGSQTVTLGTPLPIAAGRYWLAYWIDNSTDTSYSLAGANAGVAPLEFATNAGGLPATMSSLSPVATTRRVIMSALISGGWS